MAYVEIAGRRHKIMAQSGNVVYVTLGVCAAVDEVPKSGDTLTVADGYVVADVAHNQPAVCLGTNTDALRYPGRYFVTAVWDAPILLSEVGSF